MTACKWNPEKGDYLTPDGNLCRHDDYGDPTKHCSARRTCSQHVGPREQTCARCISRTRQDIRATQELATLMPTQALNDGIQSEAANLAGPSTDVRAWSHRRVAMNAHLLGWITIGRITEKAYLHARALMEDDDELDPDALLNRWHMMLADHYGDPLPARMTISTASSYLDRTLHKMAQDDNQDFPLLAREVRRCRQHLEAVLHNSRRAEKGAPCPACAEAEHYVRLTLERGHFCDEPDCDKINYATDEGDQWVCPRDRQHHWSERDYRSWVEERTTQGA